MAIVQMKRLTLLAPEGDTENLLHRLQRLGCVQLSEPSPEEEQEILSLRQDDTAALRAQLHQLRSAQEILSRYPRRGGGLLSPRPVVTEEAFLDRGTLPSDLQTAQEVMERNAELHTLYAGRSRLQARRAALLPWQGLDIPLDVAQTETVDVVTGTVPGPVDPDALAGALADAVPETALWELSRSAEQHCLLLLSCKAVTPAALELLRAYGFSTAQMPVDEGTVAQALDKTEESLAQTESRIRAEDEALRRLSERMEALRLAEDKLASDLSRQENLRRMMTDGTVSCLRGWIPAAKTGALDALLCRTDCAWEYADPSEDEIPDVPVQLKGNVFTRSMNCITEQYSLPAYNGVDPNPVMAPFFILFFGMMMADMAYGLLMIVGSLLFLKKKRPADPSFMEMIFWCGISTVVFGALTGGFLGDFIPQLCRLADPASTFALPALFTPLGDTMTIMIGSLALGAVQIFTGMAVSVVKKIRDGQFADALWDEITWWVILTGLVLMILGIGTVSGVPAVLVLGGVMLVYGSTRNAKGFGKVGALISAVYNGATGFFSDILSYVRLMALMLSGSVIAQVFNTLGATFGSIPVFIVIALVGNALNLALNLLGCYVHDMRLQFLEFFGRFYRDGGKAYLPLHLQAKHVEIIKEDH